MSCITKSELWPQPCEYWGFSDIGWQSRLGLQGRILGFRRAAEILYASMLSERLIRDLDTVIFPYAACWRHCIELQLKKLLAELRALSDLPVEGRHHHRIDQLWQEARKLIKENFADDTAELAAVTKVIRQLAQMDPDGQAFRYAASRDGSETLPGIDKINLIKFHEAIIAVANYLDAVDTGAGEYLSTKREIDSYYAAEFGPGWSDLI
ncbi:MAG TPA: hypothetical protein VMU94_25660 [Streptosporangiaceae bacterium]|nr:hypothetical protein [Streptosporangiaceae bacterium]